MNSASTNFTKRIWPAPFRELVHERKLKQADLAEKAEVGQSAISQYLAGTRVPGGWELHRLSRALGVSMEFLLTGQDTDADRAFMLAEAPKADTSELRAKLEVIETALAEAKAALKKI